MVLTWPEIRSWCIVYGVEAFVTVVVNIITVAVIIRTAFLHKRFYYLLLSLAVADFLVGAINAPMFIYVLAGSYNGSGKQWEINDPKYEIPAQTMIDIFTSYASIYSLTAIAIERLVAMLFPYLHRKESRVSYFTLILVTWLLALATSLFFLVRFIDRDDWFAMFIFIMVLLSLSLLITFVCYAIIAVILCFGSSATTLQRKERRLALTLLFASVIFIVTWLPFQVENYLYHLKNEIIKGRSHHHIYAAKFLHYCNSMVNPFIYALLIKDFRRGLKQLFCCESDNEIDPPNGNVTSISGAKRNKGFDSRGEVSVTEL